MFTFTFTFTSPFTDGRAAAWEPVTHAGLSERAALASSLHKVLSERLGLALGLYEPLTLRATGEADREILGRAQRIDPEGGFALSNEEKDGRQTALGWLTAGSVLEGIPAERNRHHFFDPSDGSGLHDLERGLKSRTRLSAVATGLGTLRGVFTGTNFDGTGQPATAWLLARENEWGLRRFLDERERAASAPRRDEREDALVRALLAAGAVLHVLEDLGDPSHVRNDYRVALFGEDARFERWVARRYGRVALPAGDAKAPVPQRKHLAELFHDPSGGGLADRTQRSFFSDGTLPDTGRYGAPAAEAGAAASGYLRSAAAAHLVRWDRDERGVHWSLDERTFADYGQALLPEAARHAQAALDLLFRGRLELAASGDQLTASLREPDLGKGTITIFADNAAGERRPLERRTVSSAGSGEVLATAHRPSWARHATAVYRGVDHSGEPLVLVEELDLK
jgi:hypothetical protein